MQDLLIIRFGAPAPVRSERQIIESFLKEGATLLPFGAIGIAIAVRTRKTAEQICEEFRQASAEHNDPLPVVITGVKAKSHNLLEWAFPNLEQAFPPVQEEPSAVQDLDLDQLLDKVAQGGVNCLTSTELQRLRELSK